MLHDISAPQHCGDLIIPSHLGHLETCTLDPSSTVILPLIRGSLHLAQLAFTAIPHLSHLYVSIVFILMTFFYDFKYDEKNVILIN
tara:strand:+ start:891 stop:1148 length:258 start_codon:yes stop_codon:yes gene_type:complete